MFSRLSVNGGRKLFLNANISPQKLTKCKFSGLACRVTNVALKYDYAFTFRKHAKVLGVHFVRHEGTVAETTKNTVSNVQQESFVSQSQTANNLNEPATQTVVSSTVDTVPEKVYISDIPDIPTPPLPSVVEPVNLLHANGEPTFASLGLGGYSPTGIVQSCLEWFHITGDMPWWSSIMLGTVIVRLLIFPLVVKTQRTVAHQSNYLPQMQQLQLKMSEARQSGNEYEAAVCAQDLHAFMKEKNINPMKNFVVVLAQVPIFISFFLALKKMTNIPVESLKTGGMWWFTDLTVADPYYLLPLITCATMYTTIELSAMANTSANLGIMKYVIRTMPIVSFPFIMNFPGAILCYWVSSNFMSVIQVGVLRINKVRRFLNIPEMVKHTKQSLPLDSKNFKEGLVNSWNNIKISRQLAEKNRADLYQFNKAGQEPIKKTFKYNPKKVEPPIVAEMLAKRK